MQKITMPNFIFIITILIQIIRIFFGVDFNDEMQYYGELVSLLNNNKLFSTDLFIQQNVYIVLFFIFKLYIKFFGNEGLILANRVLFAVFVLFVFVKVRRNLVKASVFPYAASMAALAVTFAIPLANVYAFSYNTVALAIVAVCFSEFFLWRFNGRAPNQVFWVFAILLLFLVYPTMGAVVFVVLLSRLVFEKDYKLISRLILMGLVFSAVLFLIYFNFTSFDDLVSSLTFTSSYGVGYALFTSPLYVYLFYMYLGFVFLGLFFCKCYKKLDFKFIGEDFYTSFFVFWILAVCSVLATGVSLFWYPVASLILALTGFLLSFISINYNQRDCWFWIGIFFVLSSSAMAVTSSNGFQQIQWPSMVATPFFLSFLFINNGFEFGVSPKRKPSSIVFGIGVLMVYVIIFISNPYRDERLWMQTSSVNNAPAFSYIRMTENKEHAITTIKKSLAGIPANSRVMVIGAHPWIYFALDAKPDTDMIFMHTTGNHVAHKILAERLLLRNPEYLIITAPAPDEVKTAVDEIIKKWRYNCSEIALEADVVNAVFNIKTYYDLYSTIKVCNIKI